MKNFFRDVPEISSSQSETDVHLRQLSFKIQCLWLSWACKNSKLLLILVYLYNWKASGNTNIPMPLSVPVQNAHTELQCANKLNSVLRISYLGAFVMDVLCVFLQSHTLIKKHITRLCKVNEGVCTVLLFCYRMTVCVLGHSVHGWLHTLTGHFITQCLYAIVSHP